MSNLPVLVIILSRQLRGIVEATEWCAMFDR